MDFYYHLLHSRMWSRKVLWRNITNQCLLYSLEKDTGMRAMPRKHSEVRLWKLTVLVCGLRRDNNCSEQ